MCKIVSILLRRHCTAENPMQCCRRGSRQLFIRTNPVQCYLNALGITLHRSKPYATLFEKPQTTLHKKVLCNFALILLGQHCTGQNPTQCCSRGSRQFFIRKMFHSMLTTYAILVLCNFVPSSKQNFTGKNSGNSGNVVWTTSGHVLSICIYQVLHVKKKKLWAARHSTQQTVKLLVGHYLKK